MYLMYDDDDDDDEEEEEEEEEEKNVHVWSWLTNPTFP